MTQKELSEKLFLDTQYYAQLERGERNFSIEKIVMICSLFHIGIEDIVEIDVGDSSNDEKNQLLKEIQDILENLEYSQLQFVKKFVQDMVPYV